MTAVSFVGKWDSKGRKGERMNEFIEDAVAPNKSSAQPDLKGIHLSPVGELMNSMSCSTHAMNAGVDDSYSPGAPTLS